MPLPAGAASGNGDDPSDNENDTPIRARRAHHRPSYPLSDPKDYDFVYGPEDTARLIKSLAQDKREKRMFQDGGELFNMLIHGEHMFAALEPKDFISAANITSQALVMLRNPKNCPQGARLPSLDQITEVLSLQAGVLTAPNKQGRMIDRLNEVQVTLAANAFCKLDESYAPQYAEQGRIVVAALIDPVLCHKDGLEPKAYPMLLNAFSKPAEDKDEDRRNKARDAIVEFIEPTLRHKNVFDTRSYPMLLNALSKLTEDENKDRRKKACDAIDALIEPALKHKGRFGREECPMLLNALAKLADDKDSARKDKVRNAIDELIEPALKHKDSFDCQHYAMLLNAISKLADDKNPDRKKKARDALYKLIGPALKHKDEFNHQHCPMLLNAISKLADDEDPDRKEKALDAIDKLIEPTFRHKSGFDRRAYPMVANALSKLAEDENPAREERALNAIAELIDPALEYKDRFERQEYPMLVNAFSKLAEDKGAARNDLSDKEKARKEKARNAIADLIDPALKELKKAEQDSVDHRHYPMLVNAFAKLAEDENKERRKQARDAIDELIDPVLEKKDRFERQHYPMLTNAFSKLADDKDPLRKEKAHNAIADLIDPALEHNGKFQLRAYPMLLNAFSKLIEDKGAPRKNPSDKEKARKEKARDAIDKLITPTLSALEKDEKKRFDRRHYPMLLNAISKLIDDKDPARKKKALNASVKLIAPALQHKDSFSCEEYAMLVNALAKLAEDGDKACKETAHSAIEELIDPVLRDKGKFERRAYPMLLNAFAKLTEDENAVRKEKARHAIDELIGPALSERNEQDVSGGFERQHYPMLLNAFSKLASDENPERKENARSAIVQLIAPVLQHKDDFEHRHYPMLANAISRLADDTQYGPAARDALDSLADPIIRSMQADPDAFEIRGYAMLANAYGRMLGDEMQADDPKRRVLVQIAAVLENDPQRLQAAPPRNLGMLLTTFSHAGMLDELERLAPDFLARLESCVKQNDLRDSSLETVAELVSGLHAFIDTGTLREHRARTLRLLNDGLRPAIDRKMAAYRAEASRRDPDESCAMRRPAYSCYLILKTYSDAILQWSRKNVPGVPRKQVQAQQHKLSDWLQEFRKQADNVAGEDVSQSSWNLIARMDAMNSGSSATMLDDFIARYTESLLQKRAKLETEAVSNTRAMSAQRLREWSRIQKATTQAHFDFNAVLNEMDHAPAPPPPGAGTTQLTFHSFNGQPLEIEGATAKELPYTVWSRFLQRSLPLRQVKLPGQLSQYMLGRIIYIDGIPHRLDTFGGSKMKGERLQLSDLIQRGYETQAEAQENNRQDKDNGSLIAIPLADTFPGSDLEKLISALLPNEEAFFYFQRLMIASPPDLKGVDIPPGGHVLEGRFKLGVLPDRPSREKHPFQIDDLQLHPHDGCGFIKESVAKQLGWFDQVRHCEPYAGTRPTANLPAQGLQHYGRHAGAAEELVQPVVQQAAKGKLEVEKKFRGLTAGEQTGHMTVAVPMQDKVAVPPQKSSLIDPDDPGLLVGRSPYDKPNFRDISMDKVGTADKGDPDALFLGKAIGFQYGLVGKYADETMPDGSPKLMGAKGLQVVIPDDMWPKDYAEQDIVLSNQDPKVQSDWIDNKQRATEDQLRDFIGALVVTDIFPPGSLVGVPKDEQKKLDGDFDGDTMLLLATHLRNFFEHVREENLDLDAMWAKLNGDMPPVSAKPVKTHTSAFAEDGRYRWGRAAFIMATKLMVLENFIGMQQAYLAQPKEVQDELARRISQSAYEGWDPSVRKSIHALLEEDDDPALLQPQLDKLLAQLAQDYRDTPHQATREAIAGLWDELAQWANSQGVAMKETLPIDGLAALNNTETLDSLKPWLREKVKNYSTPALRLEAWADMMPGRLLEKNPASYYPSDLEATVKRLFTEGIKKGTDAYKAPKAVREYATLAKRLKQIFADMKVPNAPYTKHLARKIAAGQVSVEGYLALVETTTNLAGQVGEYAAPILGEHGHLPMTEEELKTEQRSGKQAVRSAQGGTLEAREFKPPKHSTILSNLNTHVMPLLQQAHQLQPDVTSLLSDVAGTAGGRELNAKDRFKSDFALKEKISRISQANQCNPQEAAAAIKDTLRYCIELDEADYWKGVEDWIAGMRAKGVEIRDENIHDTFHEGSDYKGVNVAFRYTAPSDSANAGQKITAEIQFHTPASYAAKKENHKTYKEMQRTDDAAQRGAMQAIMQARCDTVRVPVRKQDTAPHAVDSAGRSRQTDKAPAEQGKAQAPLPAVNRPEPPAGAPGKRRRTEPPTSDTAVAGPPMPQPPMEVRDIRRGRPSGTSVPAAPSARARTDRRAVHPMPDKAQLDQGISRIMAAAQETEAATTPALDRIFAYVGAQQPPGEENTRFKTEEAIRQKIQRYLQYMPFEAALVKVNDGLRYARTLHHDFFVEQAKSLFTELAKAGMEVTEVRNTFKPDAIYKAVNITVLAHNGDKLEIQLHTKASFNAKQVVHPNYERLRDHNLKLPREERERLKEGCMTVFAGVQHPDGIEQVTLEMAREVARQVAPARPRVRQPPTSSALGKRERNRTEADAPPAKRGSTHIPATSMAGPAGNISAEARPPREAGMRERLHAHLESTLGSSASAPPPAPQPSGRNDTERKRKASGEVEEPSLKRHEGGQGTYASGTTSRQPNRPQRNNPRPPLP